MPYFQCRLATEDGRILSQSYPAVSSAEARKHFESEGLCVLSVKLDLKKIPVPTLPFQKKIKDKDFVMFNQEFVALIKAGYPVLKCLGVILNRMKNVQLKELLMKVEGEIRGGKSLSEAFQPYETYFSKVYTASLMAGERSGNLAGTISRFIDYFKLNMQTKSRIKTAMMYPTLLLVFSLGLLALLVNFILPSFSRFYEGFDAELPAISQVLIGFSLAIRNNSIFIVAFILFLFLVYLQMKKKERTAVLLDRLKLYLPFVRTIRIESAISLFSRTLKLLLEAGISLLSAVGVAVQAVPNKFLTKKIENLAQYIKNGESLSESLTKSEFFTPLALDMIRIGETSANLEGMLEEVSNVYDEKIRSRIETFVSLIEPIIIIFMGLLIAAMLLSVYLPIFNIIKVTR